MNMYNALAPFYARLNADVDYEAIAARLDAIFRTHFERRVDSVLDLGCGSGNITIPLLKRGYDMIGVDISEEMLAQAREKDKEGRVLWLKQDMRALELYGTVEAVVSTLDCINHLTRTSDVRACFSLVHNYLVPGGLFVFDVNSRRKFEEVYGSRAYILEEEGVLCAWQNFYSAKTHICRFDLSLFFENADGLYERFDTVSRERMYPIKTLSRLLKESGFFVLGIYDGYTEKEANDSSERITILARAVK